EPADIRTDIWACGAVLHELATAQRPFPEQNGPLLIDAILNKPAQIPTRLNTGVPPVLERIILRALEKNPAQRYQTVAELAAALDGALAGGERIAATHRLQFSRWTFVGAVAVFAMLAVGLLLLRRRDRAPVETVITARRSVA